ncbi:MAG TPA: helix-turn-helix transcriptional regulator [Candidatus Paceibacterota bacterium]|nr:helix-turn-helix transcriptional regulator [Candidatus Paceibacterota bacterium]HMO83200.1 helix-turn-helix transcriptional regulator [Candidatus Paceibacterota bacterium]
MDKNSVGQTIREARLSRGMTQTELGMLLGYSAMAISHFEKGSRVIGELELTKLFEILGLNRNQPVASTTLFRASSVTASNSTRRRSLEAFDKFISEKYGSNSN